MPRHGSQELLVSSCSGLFFFFFFLLFFSRTPGVNINKLSLFDLLIFFTADFSLTQLLQVVCAFLRPPYVGNLNSAGRISRRCTSCCSARMKLLEFCQGRLLWTQPSGFVCVRFSGPVIFLIALMLKEDTCTHASKR